GDRREEQHLAAEQARLDAADPLDVVIDPFVEGDEAAGVDLQPLAWLELEGHDRPAAVDEELAAAGHLLEDEPLAAEEAGAEPLGERDADVDVAGGAEKRVTLAEQ